MSVKTNPNKPITVRGSAGAVSDPWMKQNNIPHSTHQIRRIRLADFHRHGAMIRTRIRSLYGAIQLNTQANKHLTIGAMSALKSTDIRTTSRWAGQSFRCSPQKEYLPLWFRKYDWELRSGCLPPKYSDTGITTTRQGFLSCRSTRNGHLWSLHLAPQYYDITDPIM